MEANQRPIRFGILGPGRISRKFAAGLTAAPGVVLTAVASRDRVRAEAFAAEFSVPHIYDDYAALLAADKCDLVYIGVVNTRHFKLARQALLSGKGVLLEKPFTLTAYETGLLSRLSRERGVFLMEAMWTRFHPVSRQVLAWCAEGKIGAIRRVVASFGYFGGFDERERHLSEVVGGGSLVDVGIYPLAYASMLLGRPDQMRACALQTEAGVDRQIEVAATYGQATAALAASVTNQLGNDAYIYGETGFIEVPVFYNPTRAILWRYGSDQGAEPFVETTFEHAEPANGYEYEALAAADMVRQGRLEHPWLTHDESLSLMAQMDDCRAQIGLVYPAERGVVVNGDSFAAWPGIAAFIGDVLAAGMKFAVAASGEFEDVTAALAALGFSEADFDAVLTRRDAVRKKPDPELYLKTAEAVGLPPAGCIAVEDSLIGVLAAKAAGFETIGLATAETADALLDAGADRVAGGLDELRALLGL